MRMKLQTIKKKDDKKNMKNLDYPKNIKGNENIIGEEKKILKWIMLMEKKRTKKK